MLVLKGLVGLHRTVQLQLLQCYWFGIDLDYCDIEWFALEMNRDHSIIMPANLENSAVATGLEKVSFHSNPKERQCQRMLKQYTAQLHSFHILAK